jgi:hypothetical protein
VDFNTMGKLLMVEVSTQEVSARDAYDNDNNDIL